MNVLYRFSGCESETDTEEFEKVGQSPIDRQKMSASSAPKAIEMATSTEQIEMIAAETLTEVRNSAKYGHFLSL